jgi:hypothetical protein
MLFNLGGLLFNLGASMVQSAQLLLFGLAAIASIGSVIARR